MSIPTPPPSESMYATPEFSPPPPANETNGRAIASLILGIISLGWLIFFAGLGRGAYIVATRRHAPSPHPLAAAAIVDLILLAIGGIAALISVILGHQGLRFAHRSPTAEGRGVAITGLVFGYASVAIVVARVVILVTLIALGA